MIVTIQQDNAQYTLDLDKPIDISIPVRFDDEQLTSFGSNGAECKPFQAGSFTGSVNSGAGCNCDVLTFSPHLHGTHTECVGHISDTPIVVQDVMNGNNNGFLWTALVTAQPTKGNNCTEPYDPPLNPEDSVVTAAELQKAFSGKDIGKLEALVIRSGDTSAFLSNDAMEFINGLGVSHLLIDTPSVDREDDEGKLTNHHIYWRVEQGSHNILQPPSMKTITEHIFVPDTVADGMYMMSLQVAPIRSDAAPSRPILYEVRSA
jgi:hypothetical protein